MTTGRTLNSSGILTQVIRHQLQTLDLPGLHQLVITNSKQRGFSRSCGRPRTDDSYIDYKVGVNRNILGILAELDVVGTDVSTSGMTDAQKKPYDAGLVFSLTKTF